ncbi:very-short-patch-repair endonuclease [Bradyrhizobium sp. USDA 4524]|uniref:DUF2726 domain-containing protein n=1 Tax=unclassified Bradyrhizobium TaxID=2631580 RepID=UPI00209D5D6D|nr:MULTISPECIES: DUF2726 domain-containing protein [unclassified Bradyrhizobium]MCP1843947.1 very-short-patch-repair endonuclease [Bradyrhizobium sp. USDA 4538]MCP1904513.1 very-short-patch-repair endonuclease [Bradyrhizobium sp. USDA 4537]MCP1989831.1 very-short-patch-repair endonuclease [Bradyrhizobium sp. USDA 4539]
MKKVEALLNRSEEVAYRELQKITSDNALKVFPKQRLSDVIQKGKAYLTQREFDFYTRSHCDFVVTDAAYRPLMVVEYDGPLHQTDEKQQERDAIKNDLCRRAELGMLRINDNYVTKLYRGMTVLRWIIEVTELSKAFDQAQHEGQIPRDESFDPAFIVSSGSNGRPYPYWLSAPATQSIHTFFKTFDPGIKKGWHGIIGNDKDGNARRLSCLYFEDQVLWSTTGVRNQDLEFPDYDLLDQLDTCELGIQLKKFRAGEISSGTKDAFRRVFDQFCERYKAHPSHSMGGFPFEIEWSLERGWNIG